MKFGRFATVAFLTVAALGITAGGVGAAPESTPRELSASGDDQGVRYHAVLSDFSRSLTTAVSGGTFAVDADATAVTLTSDAGEVVATVPLAYEISGTTVEVAHRISDDGREFALEPTVTASEIGEMQPINSMARLTNEINDNVVGVVVGGVLGGLIGTVLGMGFFSILTGPIGLLVGAIAGGYAMGGQPFLDAVTAVVTGQP
ncbi:hypothetical protein [Nocardia sp. CC201C]|uniref:hypothetical protein n=1 Tax=Nocardia sp. CC201C TaxID=3044575 RepID=UPI0024A804B9|nr:hypothetical protein [Nocardia sp. CC201C]